MNSETFFARKVQILNEMVEPEEFKVDFSESSGKQIVQTETRYEGRQIDFFYIRPKGRDTWFNFSGFGQSGSGDPVPEEIPQEVREASDEAVLNKGYPIRTVNGKQSEMGRINLFYGASYHVHSFVTHPGDFYVFQEDSSAKPEGEPNSNEIYIRVIMEKDNVIIADIDAGDLQPENFVIEEAVLFKYGSDYGLEDMPTVDLKSK